MRRELPAALGVRRLHTGGSADLLGVVMSLGVVKNHRVFGMSEAFSIAYRLLALPVMCFSWGRIHECCGVGKHYHFYC